MSSDRDSVSLPPRAPSSRRRASANARRQASASGAAAHGRRPRSRARSSRTNATESPSAPAPPAEATVEDIQAEITAIEANIAQILTNLQKESTLGMNFTLESINAAYTSTIEEIRKDIEALMRVRTGNEKAETQANALLQLR